MAAPKPATIDPNAYYEVQLKHAFKWNHTWYRPGDERLLFQGSTLLLPEVMEAIASYAMHKG